MKSEIRDSTRWWHEPPLKQAKAHAEKCPVCNGKGLVGEHKARTKNRGTVIPDRCHGCDGKGWVQHQGSDDHIIPRMTGMILDPISRPTSLRERACPVCQYFFSGNLIRRGEAFNCRCGQQFKSDGCHIWTHISQPVVKPPERYPFCK